MTNPPIVLLIKSEGKILEVVLSKEERVDVYELLTKYKKLEVIDRDLSGGVLEDICG